jgi:hypothetical protein
MPMRVWCQCVGTHVNLCRMHRTVLVDNGWVKIGDLSRAIHVDDGGKESAPPTALGWVPLGDESLLCRAPAVTDGNACHLDDLWALGCIVCVVIHPLF